MAIGCTAQRETFSRHNSNCLDRASKKKNLRSMSATRDTDTETRLITINSTHRSSVGDSTTDFSVDLIDASPELRDRVIGVSVETVGFLNVINNVRYPYNDLRFTLYPFPAAPISYTATVEPGQYTYIEYAAALQQAMRDAINDTTYGPPLVVYSIPPTAGQPAKVAIRYDSPAPETFIYIPYDRYSAPFIIGMTQDIELSDTTGELAFRPNLAGPLALLLHTRSMAGSRSSVNGDGSPSETLLTVPVRVPYGQPDNIHLSGDNRPLTIYSAGAHKNLANIDVSLRHLDNTPVDLGSGEMYVTFRVWLSHR